MAGIRGRHPAAALIFAAIAITLLLAAEARAGNAALSGSGPTERTLTFTDSGAQANHLEITRPAHQPRAVLIMDTGTSAPPTGGAGCRNVGGSPGGILTPPTPGRGVVCDPGPGKTIVRLEILAGGGDDVVVSDASTALSSVLDGGAGDDELHPGVEVLNAEEVRGGDGVDAVDYSRRGPATAGVGVDPDGTADDGRLGAGEHDDVQADVEILRGTSLADVLGGGPGADVLDAGPGADTLAGGPGADRLDGGEGDDTLDGGPGADVVDGGAGDPGANDLATYALRSAPVRATLDGAAGDGEEGEGDQLVNVESLAGGAGADVLAGDGGSNTLLGNEGDDTLTGGAGADVLDGAAGADDLRGGAGGDALLGQGGADGLDGGADGDLLNGGAGDDTLAGGAGGDVLGGGDAPADPVFTPAPGVPAIFVADGPGADRLSYAGRTAAVTVTAGGRADDGEAGEGDDVLGDVETIVGGRGADRLAGADGVANLLVGGEGADALAGLGGDDRLQGGPGADTLDGGAGTDLADYSERSAPVTAALGRSAGDGREDTIAAVENVLGGAGPDVLAGDAGANRLHGGDGDDVLSGGEGADELAGGPGDDDVRARDGEADDIGCAEGADRVDADLVDAVAADCETVTRPAPPAPPAPAPGPPAPAPPAPAPPAPAPAAPAAAPVPAAPPSPAPAPAAAVAAASDEEPPKARIRTRTARVTKAGRLPIRVQCVSADEACEATVIVTMRRKGKVVRLGSARRDVGAMERERVGVRLSKATRRRMRNAKNPRVRVVVRVRDEAGNVSRTARKVLVRFRR